MIYRFGGYRIDTGRFEITRDGQPLPAEPQVLELLIMLVAHHDRVVSRDELLETVWKGRVVSDTTLSSRIKSVRRLIGDDGSRQASIRTIHGRGLRFVGGVDVEEPGAGMAAGDRPATRYARSGPVHVAYHRFGSGPVNLVIMPGFVSHIDNYWDNPGLNAWLRRLGELACVAIFDKRGTGLSDPVTELPRMDERMDDVRAVMDAVGFDSAFVMGISEGGSLAALYVAHHPERCDGLVLYGAFAEFRHWLPTEEALQEFFRYLEDHWGSGRSLPQFAPMMSADPAAFHWWGRFERLGATPGAAIALMRMNSRIDITDILPGIRVPTLVVHVADDVLIDVQGGLDLASGIPGARYVELPGRDHLPWGENGQRILAAVETFLREPRERAESTRVVATIVLVRTGDTGGSGVTEAASALRQCRATRIVAGQHGVAATFDGPARGLECAARVFGRLIELGVGHRIGIHTGEIERREDAIVGTAMEIAADVARQASAGEIVVSRTVHDLVAGSTVRLADMGAYRLPSIGRRWHLFRVEPAVAGTA